jgi:hypothetical protein
LAESFRIVRLRELLLDSLKESVVFGAIALPVAYILVSAFRISYFDSVGFVLLLESCGLMLVGGAMDLVSSPGIRKVVSLLEGKKLRLDGGAEGRSGRGAAVYTLTGVILFLSSIAIAIALAY